MDTQVVVCLCILIVGLFKCTFAQSQECTVSGDPRGRPREMDFASGNYINIFTTFTIEDSGWVTRFDYFAHNAKRTYISFWNYNGPDTTSFKLKGKIRFDAQIGYNEYTVPYDEQVHVDVGDMIGVHYHTLDDSRGTIMYNEEATSDIPADAHHVIHSNYYRDDGSWRVGDTLTIGLSGKLRAVALRLFIDCACLFGTYGRNCAQTCSSTCLNGNSDTCDRYTGQCANGCVEGYSGDLCQQACLFGTYGRNCDQTCSSTCFNGNSNTCDRYTGQCANGCVEGYSGDLCQQECGFGTFGRDCATPCSTNCLISDQQFCDRYSGECQRGCVPGFNGTHCDTACDYGRYGHNCEFTCSGNCLNMTTEMCDTMTGNCPPGGCAIGFFGSRCDTECTLGRFGSNCTQRCYCSNNEACDVATGACPHGCDAGYQGESCSQPQKQKRDGAQPPTAMIGGVVGAVVVLAVIVVFAVVIIRKRRMGQHYRKKATRESNSYIGDIPVIQPQKDIELEKQTTVSTRLSEPQAIVRHTTNDQIHSSKPALPKKPTSIPAHTKETDLPKELYQNGMISKKIQFS